MVVLVQGFPPTALELSLDWCHEIKTKEDKALDGPRRTFFRRWWKPKNSRYLIIKNEHPSREATVLVLTPDGKETMERLIKAAIEASTNGVKGALDLNHKYEMKAKNDQKTAVYPSQGADKPGKTSVLVHRQVGEPDIIAHLVVLFKENEDDDFYYLASQVDVAVKRCAWVVESRDLEVGRSKPKVRLELMNGKWSISTL